MGWERVTVERPGRQTFSYLDWREPVPRIPPEILNSVIYLYRDMDDAEMGVEIGASGCLVSIPSETVSGREHTYAVTNAHVIEGGSCIVRVNLRHPGSGTERTHRFPFERSSWVTHPKFDIAARPFAPGTAKLDLRVEFIDIGRFTLLEHIELDVIGPGDDLFYVGRFRDHAGKRENLPSVRFGNISMLPNEREPVDDDSLGERRQQVGYLVEARSRSGYSGSPVFIYWLADQIH